jgi:chemotaxis protein methyltransferase CheR
MDYEQFKVLVNELTHIDLNYYKERQMKRRIEALIAKHKFSGYAEYIERIRSDKELFEEFVNYITINVSEFYRNPEQWEILRETVIPYLKETYKNSNIRIWSAACSTGDEPYSLAMLLADFFTIDNIDIVATDIDKQVLEKARAGVYSARSLANLPKRYVDKYFTKIGERNYQICNSIKKCVDFRRHNLLLDDYPDNFHMILCRNVVIYFTEEAKNDIYRKFNQSLINGGILFVGSTEQIINYRELNYSSLKSFFYRKND